MPRWFELDDAASTAVPRLSTWVARADDVSECPAPLRGLLGPAQAMSRGTREWLITIAPDGSLALEGTLPSLIEWAIPPSPAAGALPDAGCELLGLTLSHPQPDRLDRLLSLMGLVDEVALVAGAPGIAARIRTPHGERVLASYPWTAGRGIRCAGS